MMRQRQTDSQTQQKLGKINLNLFYTNIRSLARHFNELLVILSGTQVTFDVIVLSESWIAEDQLYLYQIEGYHSLVCQRQDGRKSGGVVIYYADNLKVTDVIKEQTKTANIVKIKIGTHTNINSQSGKTELSLIAIYRDCTSSKKLFVKDLEQYMEQKEGNEIILGDMNINILDEEQSAGYLNAVMSNGYESLQNEPSRDKSCIDHILVRSRNITVNTDRVDVQITDHKIYRIAIEMNGDRVTEESGEIRYLDEIGLQKSLRGHNWNWIEESI
jgi:hypothetical protein